MLQRTFYGIDIGAFSAKIVIVRLTGDGPVVERAINVPLPPGEEESAIRNQQSAALIKKALMKAGIKLPGAVLGVSGRDAIMRYSHVPPVQPWRLKLIMDYQVEEMAGRQGHEVTSDYRMLPIARSHLDEFLVLVAMVKNEFVGARLDVMQQAGIMPLAACPNPIGLYNILLATGNLEFDRTYFIADIGYEKTDIVIMCNGDLYFARTISLGGQAFTKALSAGMGITEELAEKTKIDEAALIVGDSGNKRQKDMSTSLNAVGSQFANMVTSTLTFARSQTKVQDISIDKVLLVGGGSQLRGLDEFMAREIELPVEVFNIAGALKSSLPASDQAQFSRKMVELAAPVGLALSMGPRGQYMSMDLLPKAFKKQREFREATRYMYISAVLAVVLIISLFSLIFHKTSAAAGTREEIRKAESKLNQRELDNENLINDTERLTNALNAVARETYPGRFYTKLLYILESITPPEVTVLSTSMGWLGNDKKRKAPEGITAILDVRVYSTRGDEWGHLADFMKRLSEDSSIRKVTPVSIPGGVLKGKKFRLTIFPAKE